MAAVSNKPNLRGFHHATVKRNLSILPLIITLAVSTFYFKHNRVKKQRYAKFYKNYNAEEAFERMRTAGVFQSAPPDPPPKKK